MSNENILAAVELTTTVLLRCLWWRPLLFCLPDPEQHSTVFPPNFLAFRPVMSENNSVLQTLFSLANWIRAGEVGYREEGHEMT